MNEYPLCLMAYYLPP